MRKILWSLLNLSLVILVVVGCKNSPKTKTKVAETIGTERVGWITKSNSSGTYLLCYEESKASTKDSKPKVSFYIENANGDKVYENNIYGGYVRWLDDSKIEFFSPPGIIPSNMDKDDFIEVYDLESKTLTKKNN